MVEEPRWSDPILRREIRKARLLASLGSVEVWSVAVYCNAKSFTRRPRPTSEFSLL